MHGQNHIKFIILLLLPFLTFILFFISFKSKTAFVSKVTYATMKPLKKEAIYSSETSLAQEPDYAMSKPRIPNPNVHNAGNLLLEYQIFFPPFAIRTVTDGRLYQFAARIPFNAVPRPQQALKFAEILDVGDTFSYHCVFLNG